MTLLVDRHPAPSTPPQGAPGPVHPEVRSRLAATAAVGLSLGLSALAVARVLGAVGQGLDLSDEGMYLLSADNGTGATFHNAFGRYTGLLFALVGHDVARFRAAGVVILAAAAAVLGDRAVVAAGRCRGAAASPTERAVGVAAVVAAALHYYVLLLVTPSYNWLNLVGLLLGAAAGIELVSSPEPAARARWAWPSLLGLAVPVAAMGKLTSAPFLVGAVVVALVVTGTGRWSGRLRPLARAVPAALAVAVAHAVWVDPWPTTAAQVRRGSGLLAALDPLHYSLATALRDVARAGWTVVTGGPALLAPGLVVALGGRWWCGRSPERARWRGPVLAVATVVLGGSLARSGAWHGGQAAYGLLAWVDVAVLALGVVAVLDAAPVVTGRARHRGIAAAAVAGVGAVAYAFASGNGFFEQAGASVPLVAAVTVGVLVASSPRAAGRAPTPSVAMVALAALLGVGALLVIDGAVARPYRQPDLATATVPVRVGPSGGTVRLAPSTARFAADLRALADAHGWRRGTTLLDFTWYSASALYLLGAEPPPTVLVSVGGYEHVDDMARRTLRTLADEAPGAARSAWLLTTDGPPAPGQAPDPRLVSILGRAFPADYELVGRVDSPSGRLRLWMPREGS